MRRAALVIVLGSAACSRAAMPPGYEEIKPGLPVSRLIELRPHATPDGNARLFDPTGPIAFTVANDKVAGVRLLVRPPASQTLLEVYAERFESMAVENAPYTYIVDGERLQLFGGPAGVEILYGNADPGPAKRLIEKKSAEVARLPRTPSLSLRSWSRRPEPAALPAETAVEGVDVWTLELAGSGAASVRIVLGTGSGDDAPQGAGGTAVLAELVAFRAAAEAEKTGVDLSVTSLRAATVFALDGPPAAVLRVAEKLIAALAALEKAPFSAKDIDRGFQASMRQAPGTTLDRRVLEDEALAAMFPSSSLAAAPVERGRDAPVREELVERRRSFAGAPLRIIGAGEISAGALTELAGKAGAHPPDLRPPPGKVELPGRAARKLPDLAVAIDGFHVVAEDPTRYAMLLLAGALLEEHALHAPLGSFEVVAAGMQPASYLMLITRSPAAIAAQVDTAQREAMSSLLSALPSNTGFEELRERAYAGLVRRLSTPEDGAELLLDLSLSRARPSWVRAVLDQLALTSAGAFSEFLRGTAAPEKAFTLRWGASQ